MQKKLNALLEAIDADKTKKATKLLTKENKLATTIWKGDSKWIKGSTALHWAAHRGNLDIVIKLVELGADVNANKADWWCRPIDWASDSGRYKVVEYLLKNGAIYSGDRWSNCTPLHAVAQGGSSNGRRRSKDFRKTAKVLIEFGAEINAIAQYGGQPPKLTPLDDAQRVNNKTVEKVLLKYGAKKSKALSKGK